MAPRIDHSVPVAAGVRKGTNRRVVVSFDDETFDAIAARATAEQTSFAAIVRELVEWGLEDAEGLPA